MKIDEQKIIDTYKSIVYSRDWFMRHKYVYRFGQNFDPYVGEYFLVDLYFDNELHDTEIWLVKGCKPRYDSKRKRKLPFEPIAFIDYNKQYGTVNGYWQLTFDEAYKMFRLERK